MGFEPAPGLPRWLSEMLPLERCAYRLERGENAGMLMHMIVHGARTHRPVLMLHGNPTWSFLWRRVIRELPVGRFLAVAPDLLGFGLSSKPLWVSAHTLARHAEAVAEVTLALDLRDVILVGQDWGGPIAACLGARMPERISAVVLANTSVLVPRRPRGTAFHRFARVPVVSDLAFRCLGATQMAMPYVQGDAASIRGRVALAYRWPLRWWAQRAGPLGMARMVPDGPDHPSVPELRRGEAWLRSFSGPLALVWGEADPLLGKALARHVETFPGATVRRTRAGHFLQEEVPDAIAAAIAEVAERRESEVAQR